MSNRITLEEKMKQMLQELARLKMNRAKLYIKEHLGQSLTPGRIAQVTNMYKNNKTHDEIYCLKGEPYMICKHPEIKKMELEDQLIVTLTQDIAPVTKEDREDVKRSIGDTRIDGGTDGGTQETINEVEADVSSNEKGEADVGTTVSNVTNEEREKQKD